MLTSVAGGLREVDGGEVVVEEEVDGTAFFFDFLAFGILTTYMYKQNIIFKSIYSKTALHMPRHKRRIVATLTCFLGGGEMDLGVLSRAGDRARADC